MFKKIAFIFMVLTGGASVCSLAQSNEKIGIVISSVPSGAKIFIDGADTGRETPSRLKVEKEKKFSIKLEKKGFEPAFKADLDPNKIPSVYSIELIREKPKR